MSQFMRVLRLTVTNVFLLLACLVFASGFFPYKPFLPGLATYGDLSHGRGVPPAPFDKVIFMVVDALRSDFVFSRDSGFKFTQSLIENGAAFPFTSHAAAPTVTMPRVKAITTGSIPSFLDMILNFAESDKSSSLATQDTWLAQMKAKENGKLVMYGDDTWLKLFPDFFARADGTSSFFVSDFTEVDNNVTRHIPDELNKSDWNVMIMHYLGMDHIGHKGGPRSVNMLPKQREMDTIVRQVYDAIQTKSHLQSTLFIMCGDHGMNDNGNHGGSAPGETSPALVLMSPKFSNISPGYRCPSNESNEFEYYNLIEQSDIVPTIAGLLGFPTPMNNLGIFIPQLLPIWNNVEHREHILLNNALQIANIVKVSHAHPVYENPNAELDCGRPLSDTETLACAWKPLARLLYENDNNQSQPDALLASSSHFCKTAQSLLSSTASKYNTARLYIGVQIALAVTVVCCVTTWSALKLPKSSAALFFVTSAVLYAMMMFASSYVEEEQQFWYWTASAWIMAQSFKLSPANFFLPLTVPLKGLVLLRVLRRWNQSGQKWQGAIDIVKIAQSLPTVLLWPLVILTFQKVGFDIASRTFEAVILSSSASRFAAAFLCLTTLLLKIAQTYQHEKWLLPGADYFAAWLDGASCVMLARLTFFWLSMGVTYVVVARIAMQRQNKFKGNRDGMLVELLYPLLTLLLVAQNTPWNSPVFLLFLYQVQSLRRLPLSQAALTMITITMAHASFFAMGNTNAISSIDLSNAYNGITSYNPVPVSLLLVIGTWSGPIFWSFSGCILVLKGAQNQAKTKESVTSTIIEAPVVRRQETINHGTSHLANAESTKEPAILLESRTKPTLTTPSQRTAKQYAMPHVVKGSNSPDKSTPIDGKNENPAAPTTQTPNSLSQTTMRASNQQKYLETTEDGTTLKNIERHLIFDAWLTHAEMLTLWAAIEICAVLAACTILRTHLFVWTVFSPKFLYVGAWFICWHIGCNLILGGIMAYIQ